MVLSSLFSKKFERMAGKAVEICLRVLKESNKSRFDSYSVRNSVLIISHITFRDCRVHMFSDNLSLNSCILKHFHACSAHNDLLGDNKFYLSAVFENKNTHYLAWLESLGNGKTRFCFSVRLKKQYCCLPVVAINAIILSSEELNSMGVPCLTKPICARRTVLVMARNDGGSTDRLNK